MIATDGSTAIPAGRTRVILSTREGGKYWAKFESDRLATSDLAVWNGKVTRASTLGKVEELPARVLGNNASKAAAPTMELFSPQNYRRVLSSKNFFYAGREEIDGELCDVIGHLTPAVNGEVGSNTTFYWIEARTGFPRSKHS